MLRTLLIAAVVTSVPASLAAQEPAKPATPPATQAAGRNASAEDPFVTHEAGTPSVEQIKPDDLLRLTVVDDMLMTETTVRPGGPQLMEVAGVKVPVSVTVRHRARNPGKVYTPDAIDLNMLVRDGDRVVTTSFSTSPGNLNCSRSIETANGDYMIQFIQQLADGNTPGSRGKTSLYVQSLHEPDVKKRFVSESFTAFARSYPAELTQYVRPMLETFAPQPHLFVVSDELAAQVFPEVYRADASTRQQIAALVKQLGDESFAKRKQAEDALAKLGTKAATELALLDRSKLDPEQAARVDTVLTRTKPPYEVDRDKLRADVGFLLDCMMSQNPQLRKAALEQLQKTTGPTVTFEDSADPGRRNEQVYALRRELLPASPATLPASPTGVQAPAAAER